METLPVPDERKGLPSASAMERIHNCPGSEQLAEQVEHDVSKVSPAGLSGTGIHAVVAGESDGEDLGLGDKTVAEELERMKEVTMKAWVDSEGISVFKILTEERMWVKDPNTGEIFSAKVDLACIAPAENKALIVDLKSGFKETTKASRNYQLRTQAVALHESHNIDNIRVAIAQYRFRGFETVCEYNKMDLTFAAGELRFDLWRAKQDGAQRCPGTWCQYCKAKSICKEHAVYALLPSFQFSEHLTQKDWAFIEKRRPATEQFMKEVKDALRQLQDSELALLGMERKPGAKVSHIENLPGLAEFLSERDLCSAVEFIGLCKASLTDLNDVVVPRLATFMSLQSGKKVSLKEAKESLKKMLSDAGLVNYEHHTREPSLVFKG